MASIDSATAVSGEKPSMMNCMFLLNLLPKQFSEIRARLADGSIAAGTEFVQMLSRTAKAMSQGVPYPEGDSAYVFVHLDLRMLRECAESTSPAPAHPSNRG